MGMEYTREKMGQLVHALADGIDPLPMRLKDAFMPLSSAIGDAENVGHLPGSVLQLLQDLLDRMTRVEGPDGNLKATLEAMSPQEASDIAFELVELAYVLDGTMDDD